MGKRGGEARALWDRVAEAADKCLEIDRHMVATVEASKDGDRSPKDPDGYLAPELWERYGEARRNLMDFTAAGINVLTRSGSGSEARPDDEAVERRLASSLAEMADLEAKLAAYLTENLKVLDEAISGLTRNQTLFTKYSKTAAAKPEPGYLSSRA